MKLRVVAVGRTRQRFVQDGLEVYLGRLKGPWAVEWIDVKAASQVDPAAALAREGERVLGRLPAEGTVVALDERGRSLTSAALAQFLADEAERGTRSVSFVLGGAYGHAPVVASRASFKLSLSSMTFPHQLVRLMLAEQLYRAVTILTGSPYHHD